MQNVGVPEENAWSTLLLPQTSNLTFPCEADREGTRGRQV